jgi:hypothetical protein
MSGTPYTCDEMADFESADQINVYFLMRRRPTLIIIFQNVGIHVLEQAIFSQAAVIT